jgi:hypothetical protein
MVLQARLGVTISRDGMSTTTLPFLGIGVGRAF